MLYEYLPNSSSLLSPWSSEVSSFGFRLLFFFSLSGCMTLEL